MDPARAASQLGGGVSGEPGTMGEVRRQGRRQLRDELDPLRQQDVDTGTGGRGHVQVKKMVRISPNS